MVKMILSVVGFLVAGAIFFLYTQPTYDSIRVAEAQIREYDQALGRAAELQKIKQSLLSRYNAFNPSDLDRLQKLLPDHVDNVRLVLDLDNLAARHGMALQNVVISNPVSDVQAQGAVSVIGGGKQEYDSLTLRFSTVGTYESFRTFLEDIETSLRVVDLESLKLDRESGASLASEEGGEPLYKFDIMIRTYWLK